MTTSPAPTARTFTTIGVIGLGTMGAGIAEVLPERVRRRRRREDDEAWHADVSTSSTRPPAR